MELDRGDLNRGGYGGDGRRQAGLTMYGTPKYAVHNFTESLALEAKETPVIVGSLRPGMVVTELSCSQSATKVAPKNGSTQKAQNSQVEVILSG